MFSHFDESGDRKKLLELQRLEAIDELLKYDDSVKLVESRGNKKDEGNNYPKDAFQRFMVVINMSSIDKTRLLDFFI